MHKSFENDLNDQLRNESIVLLIKIHYESPGQGIGPKANRELIIEKAKQFKSMKDWRQREAENDVG